MAAPTWLYWLSWIYLALAFVCAGIILWDIFGRGYRGRMGIMDAVWPITALYLGPVALWGYFKYGKPDTTKWLTERQLDSRRLNPSGSPFALTCATAVPGAPWETSSLRR